MPSSIISFSDFRQRLNDAIADVERFATTDGDPMLGSIQRQLGFVKLWTEGGRRPTQVDLDKLTFGQMASRSVHESDARLANELYELSSYLIFWPSSELERT